MESNVYNVMQRYLEGQTQQIQSQSTMVNYLHQQVTDMQATLLYLTGTGEGAGGAVS